MDLRVEVPHQCPVNDCGLELPPVLLMCQRHWFMTPFELRAAMRREFRLDRTRNRAAGGTASQELRGAQLAAIAAVEELTGA